MLCGFSSLWWPFGWNWSYLGFLGIIWRTCGSKCRGEGGGIFPTLCLEFCLVYGSFLGQKHNLTMFYQGTVKKENTSLSLRTLLLTFFVILCKIQHKICYQNSKLHILYRGGIRRAHRFAFPGHMIIWWRFYKLSRNEHHLRPRIAAESYAELENHSIKLESFSSEMQSYEDLKNLKVALVWFC